MIMVTYAKRMNIQVDINFSALDYLKFHINPLIRVFGSFYSEWVQHKAVLASLAGQLELVLPDMIKMWVVQFLVIVAVKGKTLNFH